MTILKMTAEDYTLSAEYLGPMLEALQKRGIDEQEALAGLDIEPGCWRDPKARVTALVIGKSSIFYPGQSGHDRCLQGLQSLDGGGPKLDPQQFAMFLVDLKHMLLGVFGRVEATGGARVIEC